MADREFLHQFLQLSAELAHLQLVPGDRLSIPKAFDSPYYDILDTYVRLHPEEEEFTFLSHLQMILRVRIPHGAPPRLVEVGGDRQVTVKLSELYVGTGVVMTTTDTHIDVELVLTCQGNTECDARRAFWHTGSDILESKRFGDLWTEFQEKEATEGVTSKLHQVPDELRNSLLKGIDEVAKQELEDYHPGTNNIVRDHVHPSLYPYIKGVSEVVGSNAEKNTSGEDREDDRTDFWGRPYEDSIYQWLPAQFCISGSGHCSIESYINNLSRERHPSLYSDLERLFEILLPQFEDAYSYIQAADFRRKKKEQAPDFDDGYVYQFYTPPPKSLMLQDLQVVTKIVDYELSPGESFDGVWHVEGMSHENIIATGIYVIERCDGIVGGDLLFKRAFFANEAQSIFSNVPQCRHLMTEKIIDDGLLPLGKLTTEEHRTIVFPNSHVHKVDTIYNAGEKDGHRRIIVFFLINPDVDIISTRDVEPQQGVISREDALQHRLKLMEERKRHKQDWNVRTIELCEH